MMVLGHSDGVGEQINYVVLNFLGMLLVLIFVMVGVAFLTLLERKILSYIQDRKGPNKVGLEGILQPFSDGAKLLFKEMVMIYKSNYNMFYYSPVLSMMMMVLCWLILPWVTNVYCMNYSLLVVFIFLSLGGYLVLLMGWSSNSSYSMIGSIRLVAQLISYEVSFILILFCVVIMIESFSMPKLVIWQIYMWNMVMLMPVFLVMFFSILAELNRSPMDLVEGESELVSGFNIEYFSGGFALIFLGEYGMIMFFSYMLLLMFTNLILSDFGFTVGFILMIMGVIYMRGILPRMRYDVLMFMCWKIVLPLVLNYMIFIFSVKVLFM